MNKEEFLDGLQHALSGGVPVAAVQENLRYYGDYIQTEIQKGRNEAEIMEELGDPRLIARTIIDTTPGVSESEANHSGSSWRNQAEESGTQADNQGRSGVHHYDLNKWVWKFIGIAIIVLVVVVIFTIVSGLLSLVIPMLPVIGLVALVMWFVRGSKR